MILSNNRFIKYIIFAIITSFLNVGTYLLIYNYVVENIIISNIFAYVVSITISFLLNKKIVFKNENKNILVQLLLYFLVKVISFNIDSLVLYITVNWLNINNFVAKLIANMSTTISNYAFNNKLVFKPNKDNKSKL